MIYGENEERNSVRKEKRKGKKRGKRKSTPSGRTASELRLSSNSPSKVFNPLCSRINRCANWSSFRSPCLGGTNLLIRGYTWTSSIEQCTPAKLKISATYNVFIAYTYS